MKIYDDIFIFDCTLNQTCRTCPFRAHPQVVPGLLESTPAPYYIIITGYMKAVRLLNVITCSVHDQKLSSSAGKQRRSCNSGSGHDFA